MGSLVLAKRMAHIFEFIFPVFLFMLLLLSFSSLSLLRLSITFRTVNSDFFIHQFIFGQLQLIKLLGCLMLIEKAESVFRFIDARRFMTPYVNI